MGSNDRVPRSTSETSGAENQTVASLLDFAGSRQHELSPEVFTMHSDAALLVWKRQIRARRIRRSVGGMALLAAAVLMMFGLRTGMFKVEPSSLDVQVASVEAVSGMLEISRLGAWQRLLPGEAVEAGRSLRTSGGPARLEAFGASLRVSSGTEMAILEGRKIRLARGRLYVDTGASSERVLTIETSFGSVMDIGTQFEVVLGNDGTALDVRVRSGSVQLTPNGSEDVHVAVAGEQIRMTEPDSFALSSVATHGDSWSWILKTSQSFELEGASMAEYLDWLKAELGWTVRFESDSTEQDAKSIRLSGSPTQLPPNETVGFVLPSLGFEHEVVDGVLTIK